MGDFRSTPRREPPDQIVIHESAGSGTRATLVNTLRKKGLGTHYIIDWFGKGVTEHANPLTEVVSHASGFNTRAVGFDVINPVDPRYAGRIKKYGFETMQARHRGGAQFIIPPLDSCERAYELISTLVTRPDLNIPNTIPGLSADGKLGVGTLHRSLFKEAGIFSHAQLTQSRTDGTFQLIYYALRRSGAFDAQSAYATAQEIDTGKGNFVVIPLEAQTENIPPARVRLQLFVNATRRGFQKAWSSQGTAQQQIAAAQTTPVQGTFVINDGNKTGLTYDFQTGRWNDEV